MLPEDRTKKYLSRAIKRSRLGHALLLLGESTALRNLSNYLAMLLLCENAIENDDGPIPCETCKDCIQVIQDKHINQTRIGPVDSKEIRIDQIRTMREHLRLSNFNHKPQIFIFTDANSFTNQAANALLKSIEEPIQNQFFLLLGSSISLVQKTLISRCQRLIVPHNHQVKDENDEEKAMRALAQKFLDRILKDDFSLRVKIIDELLREQTELISLVLEIKKLLHHQLRNSLSLPKKYLLVAIEATNQTHDQLRQNVNPQLSLENWLLNSWPA